MMNLDLEQDEEVLLQATEVWRYDKKKELGIDIFYLTSKNLISVYEKSKGLLSKAETIIDKIPLSQIKVVNGVAQVKQVKDEDYGHSLEIVFCNGMRELLEFTSSPKKEYPLWEAAIIDAVSKCNIIAHSANQSAIDIAANASAYYRTRHISFCSSCGTKLDSDAKFCKGCGTPIVRSHTHLPKADTLNNLSAYEDSLQSPFSEPKSTYSGSLYKCPRCNAVLPSFSTNCPYCGHEIRGAKTTSAIQDLALKLEQIESRKPPVFEEKRSVVKMIFGKDFKDNDDAEEARRNFERQKKKEKETLIINFAVPNTKEDIVEFILLASSNIKTKETFWEAWETDIISKAWLSKLEQVYQKAELLMGNSPEFQQIKKIYDDKKKQLMKLKVKSFLPIIACFLLLLLGLFVEALMLHPVITIIATVCVILLAIYVFQLYKNSKKSS